MRQRSTCKEFDAKDAYFHELFYRRFLAPKVEMLKEEKEFPKSKHKAGGQAKWYYGQYNNISPSK